MSYTVKLASERFLKFIANYRLGLLKKIQNTA